MQSHKLLTVFIIAVFCSCAFAQDKTAMQSDTTILNILQDNTGKTVELRLDSGDKIGGTVEALTQNVIHLTHLTGAEFFDAYVDVESVSAVVVRRSTK